MTFTNYIHQMLGKGHLPKLWVFIVDHDAWPLKSTKLEDYEAFVRRYVGGAQREAIPELRTLWLEWHTETGQGRIDLALAAWRDYALHLRDCPLQGARPCPRSDALFARAVAVSEFHDLAINEPDPYACEASATESLGQFEQVIDQIFDPSDVIHRAIPVARQSLPSKSLRRKP